MKFTLVDNVKEIECDIVMTFNDETNKVNYIVYTDGTKDKEGKLEIYASRYKMDGKDYILNPIENDYEWNLIDNMLGAEV